MNKAPVERISLMSQRKCLKNKMVNKIAQRKCLKNKMVNKIAQRKCLKNKTVNKIALDLAMEKFTSMIRKLGHSEPAPTITP
jgi:hypothetical protein